MSTNYVLIDFENVQPRNLEILENHPFKIFVFVGANQTKVPFDLATVMQNFGDNAQYIKISGNGQNALDFHIAFYIGQLSLQDPAGLFHIISKDKGFDPLIKHLRTKKIKVYLSTQTLMRVILEGESLSRMQSEPPSDLPFWQGCTAVEPRRAGVPPTARIPTDPG